jgi:hypothetical protein
MGSKSYSKGISWIDDCRIPFVDEKDNNTTRDRYDTIGYGSKMNNGWGSMDDSAKQGRFPANLLVSDDMLNDGVITKQNPRKYNNKGDNKIFVGAGKGENYANGDKGTNSRYYDIDCWFDNLIDV